MRAIHYLSPDGIGNPWVANELNRIEAAGIGFVLHAMRPTPQVRHTSEWALRMNQRTMVIYPLPWLDLLVSVLTAPFLFGRRFFAALANALIGEREHWRARFAGIAHLFVACHWARGVAAHPQPAAHVHSQWVNACGTIAMYGAWLLGVPYSFTGHAADLFRDRCALRDKIRRAEFIVCISEFHRRFYLEQGARPEQLFIVYCGINPEWFYPRRGPPPERVYRILSCGRLVEKKGFAYLIDACRILADRGERFECVIGGNGELEGELRSRIEGLGLSGRVRVTGEALIQEKIVDFMHAGDVYVLPCVWARDRDVDGLPQMLMEAMACGVPAVSTRLVGIPDLVRHEETGLLVEPNDAAALADAISRLMHDHGLGARLAEAGRRWMLQRFNVQTCVEPLIARYRERLGLPATPPGSSRAPRAREGFPA